MSHSGVEAAKKTDGDELLRLLFQDHVDLRAVLEEVPDAPVVGADGVVRPHVRRQGRVLASIFGKVDVSRPGHGQRGKDSLRPLDASLNLPHDLYSFGVRRRLAIEVAKGSFDAAIASLKTRTSPGEKGNAKHMAKLASVYITDPHIRTPEEVATPPKKEERRPAAAAPGQACLG